MAEETTTKVLSTKCNRTECHQNNKACHCIALIDTDFNGRECPFFKTDREYEQQEAKRLAKKGVKAK